MLGFVDALVQVMSWCWGWGGAKGCQLGYITTSLCSERSIEMRRLDFLAKFGIEYHIGITATPHPSVSSASAFSKS